MVMGFLYLSYTRNDADNISGGVFFSVLDSQALHSCARNHNTALKLKRSVLAVNH